MGYPPRHLDRCALGDQGQNDGADILINGFAGQPQRDPPSAPHLGPQVAIGGHQALHQKRQRGHLGWGEERDDAEFVKVFAAGVAASYELTKTAQRVFQVVLDQYQRTPMSRGYADSIELFWFGDGIEGRDVGMSERTFRRGLIELLEKRFLYPKTSSSFWTNPALFFKGDRVLFIKEYRRRQPAEKDELEARGQQRLEV